MSRIYLEAVEVVTDETTEPEFIRADITGKTDTEIEAIKTDIKDIMAGMNYRLMRHICRHDEGSTCRMEEEI